MCYSAFGFLTYVFPKKLQFVIEYWLKNNDKDKYVIFGVCKVRQVLTGYKIVPNEIMNI